MINYTAKVTFCRYIFITVGQSYLGFMSEIEIEQNYTRGQGLGLGMDRGRKVK